MCVIVITISPIGHSILLMCSPGHSVMAFGMVWYLGVLGRQTSNPDWTVRVWTCCWAAPVWPAASPPPVGWSVTRPGGGAWLRPYGLQGGTHRTSSWCRRLMMLLPFHGKYMQLNNTTPPVAWLWLVSVPSEGLQRGVPTCLHVVIRCGSS